MNIRKITHNRRRQHIGNLITGVLNHFGKSTEENLTESVLNYSTQPREYVEFAVRRTLNCGVRHGFLVKSGHNTFDVPHLICETDSGKARKSKNVKSGSGQAKKSQDVKPGSGQAKKPQDVNPGSAQDEDITFEERFNACYNKHNANPQNCVHRDIITNGKCSLKTVLNRKYCRFHMDLETFYDYAIFLVENILEPETRKCLEKHYADYKDLETVLTVTNVRVYQQRLINFLEDIQSFYAGYEDEKMKTLFSKEVEFTYSDKCNGIQIENKSYEICGKKQTFKKTCEEHNFYVQMLRGFCRTPTYYGTNSDGKKTVPTKSFAEGVIASTLLPRTERGTLSHLTKASKCAYISFVTITRYHRLLLTGTRFKDDYRDRVLSGIQHANKVGYYSQAPGNCFCLNLPAVFRKFGQNEPWPTGFDFERNPQPPGDPLSRSRSSSKSRSTSRPRPLSTSVTENNEQGGVENDEQGGLENDEEGGPWTIATSKSKTKKENLERKKQQDEEQQRPQRGKQKRQWR